MFLIFISVPKFKESLPLRAGEPNPNPTWYGDISHMLTKQDIACMGEHNIDLAHYDTVRERSLFVATIFG